MPDTTTTITALSRLTREIVENRKGVAAEFIQKKVALQTFVDNLSKIEDLGNKSLWLSILNSRRISPLWSEIIKMADKIKGDIEIALSNQGSFMGAFERATRKHINLGAVGITREGKSSYVRKVTGVDEWLVPTRRGAQPCTTASINLINGKTDKDETGIARVYFLTLNELVHYLSTWIIELGGGDDYLLSLKEASTKEKFIEWCLNWPTMESHGDFGDGQSVSKKKFITYLANVDEYINNIILNEADKNIPNVGYKDYLISDINKHGDIAKNYYASVSYYDSPGGTQKKYLSYATRLAEVYTNFSDTENIQFLDTPGIGENKAGIEKTLSDAITMKLDIVIVIKAVYAANTDKASQLFYNLLRERLTNHTSAKDWVYYILNVFKDNNGNFDFNQIIDQQKEIQVNLNSIQKSSSAIELDPNHFRYINIDEDSEYLSQDNIRSEHPLERYLEDILNELIPKIKKIDQDFFTLGNAEYNKIVTAIRSLSAKLRSLSHDLPTFDDHTRIENLIEQLSKKLSSNTKPWRHLIEKTLKPSIEDFKDEPIGSYVKKILNLSSDDTDLSELNHDQIRTFCTRNRDQIELFLQETSYDNNTSFADYSTLKGKLKQELIQGVLNQIKEQDAVDGLTEIKENLASILSSDGGMSFIALSSSKDWWNVATEYLCKDKNVSELLPIFIGIRDMEINAKKNLEPAIIEAVKISLNKDDFGESNEQWNFKSFNGALCRFIYSLLYLEASSKLDIEVAVFDTALSNLQKDINARCDMLWNLPTNQSKEAASKSRKQLYSFYKRHLNEIFTDDIEAQKASLVDDFELIEKALSE